MKKSVIYLLVLVLVYLLGNAVYEQGIKIREKEGRLECHKGASMFERTYNKTLLEGVKKSVNARNFKYVVRLQPSIFMETKLFSFVKKKDIDIFFNKELSLGNHFFKEATQQSSIDILIYENDKEDPGKKTDKSKLYAGYLVISFYQNNELIYRVQIDFLDDKGGDIPQKISCAIKTFFSAE